MIGIQESASFNAAMVAIKVAAVLFVIVVGAFYVNPANWHPFAPYGLTGSASSATRSSARATPAASRSGMLAGAALWPSSPTSASTRSPPTPRRRKNPQRDVPIGIIVSLVLCTLLYIAVVAVLTGMVPYDQLDIDAPVADAFQQVGLRWAQFLIAAAGVAGITSVLLVTMLSQAAHPAGHGPRRPAAAELLRRRPPERSARPGSRRSSPASSSASLAALPADRASCCTLVNIGTLLRLRDRLRGGARSCGGPTRTPSGRSACRFVPRGAHPGHRDLPAADVLAARPRTGCGSSSGWRSVW